MNVEKVKEITSRVLFTEKGESVNIIEGIDILNLENLSEIPMELLLKIKTQLSDVIEVSMLLEKEGFTANCDYCIDVKFHECLSGTGNYVYMTALNEIESYLKANIKRGFEYVDVKHRKNEELAELPRRGTNGSAGYDFHCPIDVVIPANSQVLIWSDVRAYMMSDEVLTIYPRSSMGKHGIELSNTVAVIDKDYYRSEKTDGNIGIMIKNTSDKDFSILKDDRVCQGMFIKYLTTDDDNPVASERVGGMGSTGK